MNLMVYAGLLAALAVGLAWPVGRLRRLKHVSALDRHDRSAGIETFEVTVDGTRVFCRLAGLRGPGPAVVLVHGLVVSSRYLRPLLSEMASEFLVYAPDLPGFGESGKPRRRLDVDGLADALVRWMRCVDLPRASFVGTSFGCQVVAALAVRHPDVVERAVLVAPTVDPAARSLMRQVWRLAVNSMNETAPGLGEVSRIDYAKAGVATSVHATRTTLRDRIEERLPHVMQPTLVVRGRGDPLVPQDWAEQAAELIPRGRLKVIDGTHTLNFTHPRALSAVISPFLARQDHR